MELTTLDEYYHKFHLILFKYLYQIHIYYRSKSLDKSKNNNQSQDQRNNIYIFKTLKYITLKYY